MRIEKILNTDKLISNIKKIKQVLKPSTELMAVVKSDAYGHGMIEVSKALDMNYATAFAVANIDEAIKLRQNNIQADILILGSLDYTNIEGLITYNIMQTITRNDEAYEIEKFIQNHYALSNDKCVRVHIKTNTGMNRLGYDLNDFDNYMKKLSTLHSIKIDGIFSHLAFSDDKALLQKAQDKFEEFLKVLDILNIVPKRIHLLNSAGIINDNLNQYTTVRAGICMHGLFPSSFLRKHWDEKGIYLEETLTIKTYLAHIRTLSPGDTVSYDGTFKATKELKIGVVPIGYDDGYIRKYSNKARVKINNRLAPVVGKICMNMFMINLENIDANIGDEIIILGDEISADELASYADTISYEVLCNFKF